MAKNTAGVVLECVKCKARYTPLAGVMRYCGVCGSELKPVEKVHRPAEKLR